MPIRLYFECDPSLILLEKRKRYSEKSVKIMTHVTLWWNNW